MSFRTVTCFLSIRSCRDPPALSLRIRRPPRDPPPTCCLVVPLLATGDLCAEGSVWVDWMESDRAGVGERVRLARGLCLHGCCDTTQQALALSS